MRTHRDISAYTIGVTTIAFSKRKELVERLRALGFGTVKTNEAGKRFARDELIAFLRDCQAAIVGLDIIDDSLLRHLPDLRVISKYGVGLDNINLDDCDLHNVQVRYTAGVNKRSVAELTLGLIIGLLRNICLTSFKMQNGVWFKDGGFRLSGKTVGIIGVGNVGKDLVSLLKPFNCRIMVNDIIDQEQYYQDNCLVNSTKQDIFKQADIITVHTPLTEKTRNMINSNSIGLMKKSAVIINTARGGIINFPDLKKAVISQRIAGVGLDVYDKEPPEDTEFLTHPNVIATPHIAGNSVEAVNAMGIAAINNIKNFYL
jgi:phosphoglycerate dehydrogenase-like enzyme